MKSYRSARSARTIIGKHAKVQKPGKTSKETESITEVPQPFPIIQDQIPKIFVEGDYKSNQLVKEGNTLPVTAQKKRHHIEDASRLKTAPTRDQE